MKPHMRFLLGGIVDGELLSARILVWQETPSDREFWIALVARNDYSFGIWLRGGWGFANGNYGLQQPVWTMPSVDPLAVALVRGSTSVQPQGALSPSPARFCANCGTARTPGGRFCSHCGGALPEAGGGSDFVLAIQGLRPSPGLSGAVLAELIERNADLSPLTPDARSLLLDLVRRDFSQPSVRLVEADSTSSQALTLERAQLVQDVLVSGQELSGETREWARLLLVRAPLQPGYWGPFKALLKRGPLPGLEEPFGVALSRLNKRWSRYVAPSAEVQDVGLLAMLWPPPSEGTLTYMRRRTRRDLASLATLKPGAYAEVSTSLLLNFDEPLNDKAFGPAYVMQGHWALNSASRRVDLTSDWPRRCDPHPEIWNSRLGLVSKVFDRTTNSPEAFTWSYLILEDQGQSPRLTPARLPLALRSRNRPLWNDACAMLPQSPETLKALDESAWRRIFRNAPDSIFSFIQDQIHTDPINAYAFPGCFLAARRELVAGALSHDRAAAIARYYLACFTPTRSWSGNWWFSRPWQASHRADYAAWKVLLHSGGIPTDSYWPSFLRSFPVTTLLTLFEDISEAPPPMIDMLIGAIAGKWLEPPDVERVLTLGLQTPGAIGDALLWRVIDSRGGIDNCLDALRPALASGTLDRLRIRQFFEAAAGRVPLTQLPMLLSLSQEMGGDLRPLQLLEALVKAPGGPASVWEYLLSEDPAWLVALVVESDSILASVGDSLNAADCRSADGPRAEVLAHYLRRMAQRLARDPSFGLAAASNLNTQVQAVALEALTSSGAIDAVWLQLLETALPSCCHSVWGYLQGLQDEDALKQAILACLDSAVPAAQQVGVQLLDRHQRLLEDAALWVSLSESDDPSIQRMVAEEALVRASVNPSADFDRRVLVTRRQGRKTKGAVQQRLDGLDIHDIATPERLDALLDLARGSNARDRDWALSRLAILALAGAGIEGVDVRATTEASL